MDSSERRLERSEEASVDPEKAMTFPGPEGHGRMRPESGSFFRPERTGGTKLLLPTVGR